MSIVDLRKSGLFAGLGPEQIERVLALTQEETFDDGDVIIREGDPSNEVYVICSGMVEVEVAQGVIADVPGPPLLEPVVHLGQGQVFGEMALMDRGKRSATVRCIQDGTMICVIPSQGLWALCEGDHSIGFIVMRNIASDLSFKLRHRNLRMGLSGGGT
jgi:CRP-like cAMP-binding protein